MENASKALIMAGGVMLVMLIIALFIYAWGIFSDYYSSQDDLSEITDLTEFNLQFTNYDRKDVSGYELISLANKVADYNNRFSSATDAKNDEKYNPITLTIDFVNNTNIKKLTFDDNLRLFNSGTIYTQSAVRNDIEKFITTALGIEKLYGNSDTAAKVAKNINSLVLSRVKQYNNPNNLNDDELERQIVADYNALTKSNVNTYGEVEASIGANGEKIYQYYEYYQFKKAKFECTNIEYDNVSGRVSKIDFKFTGEIE